MPSKLGTTTVSCALQLLTVFFTLGLVQPASAQVDIKPLLAMCAACHGADGHSLIPGTPSLAGQPKVFLENALVMIREGMRDVPQMKGIVEKITDEQFVALAKHYSELPVKPNTAPIDAQKIKRGAEISKATLCGSCHLPNFSGQQQMPRLAGQREDFLYASMLEFRDGKALGRDTMMAGVLRNMSDVQISDLAHYFTNFGR